MSDWKSSLDRWLLAEPPEPIKDEWIDEGESFAEEQRQGRRKDDE